MKKYNNFLTIFLIILIITLTGVLGYYLYLLYDNYKSKQTAEKIIFKFSQDTNDSEPEEVAEEVIEPFAEPTQVPETPKPNNNNNNTNNNNNNSNRNNGTYYNDAKVIGIIEIPSLNVKYPIFDKDNTETLNIGTAAIYPDDVENRLNKPGNVVIAGHNYRNNKMFSKLHTLKNGDLIYIEDNSGKRLAYKVYNNYTANYTDFTYATRPVDDGVAEISLSTCTNNVNTRTVIWAKTEQ